MTIVNINITTPNSTNTYAVKAPPAPVPEYDYEQCFPSQATGVAVLRYSPSIAEVVAGEYYANSSELIKYLPFTIEYNYIAVTSLNIYLKKHSDLAWLLYGKELPASGQSTFALLPSDFIAGDDIDVKIVDADNATVLDIIENQHIYVTMSITSYPTSTPLATNFTVSGKANCAEVKITFTSVTGEISYVVSVVNGVYSKADCTLSTVDGFVPFDDVSIKVEDNIDALSYVEQVDALVVVPTMEFDTPIELVAGIQKAVTGTSNYIGQQVELESRLSGQVPEDSWTTEGFATVDEFGVWSINVTVASASTRDFRLIDYELDPAICSAQVDDVVVVVSSETYLVTDAGEYLVDDDSNKLII